MQTNTRQTFLSFACAALVVALNSTAASADTITPIQLPSYDPVTEALARGLTPRDMDRSFDKNILRAEYCDPTQTRTDLNTSMSCTGATHEMLAG